MGEVPRTWVGMTSVPQGLIDRALAQRGSYPAPPSYEALQTALQAPQVGGVMAAPDEPSLQWPQDDPAMYASQGAAVVSSPQAAAHAPYLPAERQGEPVSAVQPAAVFPEDPEWQEGMETRPADAFPRGVAPAAQPMTPTSLARAPYMPPVRSGFDRDPSLASEVGRAWTDEVDTAASGTGTSPFPGLERYDEVEPAARPTPSYGLAGATPPMGYVLSAGDETPPRGYTYDPQLQADAQGTQELDLRELAFDAAAAETPAYGVPASHAQGGAPPRPWSSARSALLSSGASEADEVTRVEMIAPEVLEAEALANGAVDLNLPPDAAFEEPADSWSATGEPAAEWATQHCFRPTFSRGAGLALPSTTDSNPPMPQPGLGSTPPAPPLSSLESGLEPWAYGGDPAADRPRVPAYASAGNMGTQFSTERGEVTASTRSGGESRWVASAILGVAFAALGFVSWKLFMADGGLGSGQDLPSTQEQELLVQAQAQERVPAVQAQAQEQVPAVHTQGSGAEGASSDAVAGSSKPEAVAAEMGPRREAAPRAEAVQERAVPAPVRPAIEKVAAKDAAAEDSDLDNPALGRSRLRSPRGAARPASRRRLDYEGVLPLPVPAPAPAGSQVGDGAALGQKAAAAEESTSGPSAADAGGTSGDLPSVSELKAAMEAIRGRALACVGQGRGVAVVQGSAVGSGRVTHALILGDFAGTPEGSCIARAVRSAKLPGFEGELYRFTYDLRL